MSARFVRYASALCLVGASVAAQASPVGLDGLLGAEWNGVNAVVVAHGDNPSYDFQHPGTTTEGVSYNVYLRSDSNYLYGLFSANGSTPDRNWANVYFDTDGVDGSDFGMELGKGNHTGFYPSTGFHYDLSNYLTVVETGGDDAHVIEFALSWDFFTTNPDGVLPDAGTGIDVDSKGVQMRLSQTYGYAVAGGDLAGGTRFGTITRAAAELPEPSGIALTLAALGAATLVRRKAAKKG